MHCNSLISCKKEKKKKVKKKKKKKGWFSCPLTLPIGTATHVHKWKSYSVLLRVSYIRVCPFLSIKRVRQESSMRMTHSPPVEKKGTSWYFSVVPRPSFCVSSHANSASFFCYLLKLKEDFPLVAGVRRAHFCKLKKKQIDKTQLDERYSHRKSCLY